MGVNESSDMLKILQDIIAELTEDGGMEIPVPSAVGTSLDISPGTIRGLAYILAYDYADDIGKELSLTSRIAVKAKEARNRLKGKSTVSREISFENDGLAVPRGQYNINSDT